MVYHRPITTNSQLFCEMNIDYVEGTCAQLPLTIELPTFEGIIYLFLVGRLEDWVHKYVLLFFL